MSTVDLITWEEFTEYMSIYRCPNCDLRKLSCCEPRCMGCWSEYIVACCMSSEYKKKDR